MLVSSMNYHCDKCKRKWDNQAALENEFFCTRKCGGKLSPLIGSEDQGEESRFARSHTLSELVPQLPSTLAIVLDSYNRQVDDYQALHQMCGALEITARFLSIVVLAEVWSRHAGDEESFPEILVQQLVQHLERPTLGSWRVLLAAAVEALPGEKKHKQCMLPQLPTYASEFVTSLGSGKGDPRKKLLPMRNLIAHGGRLSDKMVSELVEGHAKRFEALLSDLAFVSADSGVLLIASPSRGPACCLRGPSTISTPFDRTLLPEEFGQAGPERMLLVTPAGVLDLCPLHAYGEVFHVVRDQLEGQGENAIHLYSRAAEPSGIEYTTLGSRAAHSRGTRLWEKQFASIFRLEAWRARHRAEAALEKYSFQRRMDDLLLRQTFIARDEQVAAAAAKIDAIESGVAWLPGKPGMGKSAFMASLVRDYLQRDAGTGQARADVICIPYFFQASDGERCRTTSFAEAAILALARATSQAVKADDDPQRRKEQLQSMLATVAEAEAQRKVPKNSHRGGRRRRSDGCGRAIR